MREVMQAILNECEHGRTAVLVSVISASGSAPRKTGAQMAVGAAGLLAGSVGGGSLEHSAVQKARACVLEKRSVVDEHRLKDGAAASEGMICGGDVELLYTCVEPSEESLRTFSLAAALSGSAAGWLILPLAGGAGFLDAEGKLFGLDLSVDPDTARGSAGIKELSGVKCFVQKLTARTLVYIFGGGHLSQELAPLLHHLEFRCVVADDREEFSRRELFPDAEAVCVCDYADLSSRFHVKEGDFIVSLTRGHAGDYEVEKFALGTPASYIGVVGSRTKSETLRRRLTEEGFSDEELDRVTSPVGIPILSDTPAEIAVSIAAQLIERRARLRDRENG